VPEGRPVWQTLANPHFDTAIYDLPVNSTSPVLAEALLSTNAPRGRWCTAAASTLTGQSIDTIDILFEISGTIRRLIFSYLFLLSPRFTKRSLRIFGIIPNFYVVYDHDAPLLTTKLKFKLATKVLFDPVTIVGVAAFAGINQAADNPNYGQGAKGYGERLGAGYADGAIDIMVGGRYPTIASAPGPALLLPGHGHKQVTRSARTLQPIHLQGRQRRLQPNYSTIGGDLASAALANAYYPESNRGVGLFLRNFLIATGQRALANVAQEFILRRLTPKAKNQN
jgi:hypothetical protein